MSYRVLIVDDEPAIAEMLGTVLQRDGCEVELCFTGEDALRRMTERPPDLILMDTMIPPDDGLTVVRRLRKFPEYRDVSIVLFGVQDDGVLDWKAAGADGYVPKPFDVPRLAKYLRRVLEGEQEPPAAAPA